MCQQMEQMPSHLSQPHSQKTASIKKGDAETKENEKTIDSEKTDLAPLILTQHAMQGREREVERQRRV